ncbi:MAG: chemotaxis protein CheR [Gallionellales bacterium RIFCSPLOWO2_02_FULL_57_47]|nr:MAG: chemotaxis protein CheR [Gallionellales bacterium RIFCSPLOWO2_02_FULL_57_47]OGT16605.1 MAG: chemotaxis protein CheR [Gallionellales bacterium RIFCSPHIGHO2_02_FULL_57_16]
MSSNLQSVDGHDREFAFTRENFERVCRLIYEHAGISLKPSKQHMVYSRLARRLRVNGLDNFRDYLVLLESGNKDEWEAFVNSLTTNLTSFFREPHHFPLLAEHVIKQRGQHPVSLWCAAASSGEEPYSIAMTMVDAFGSFSPPVTIVASDLDTNVLAKAEAGIYPVERIEKLSENVVKRFFLKGTGAQSGFVRVRPELRAMIKFRQVNLLGDDWQIRGPLDAIFCRNVMIYFDKETQLKILQRFAPLLQPDGLVFAGHSESFHNAAHLFRLRGKTVYELVKSKPRELHQAK